MGPAPSALRSGAPLPAKSNTLDTSMSGRSIPGSALKNVVPVEEMPPPPAPPFSSKSKSSSSGGSSPASSLSGRRSPHRRILRSATAPISTRSPSPDAMPLPQDSAFPVFPTARSQSTTPTTPHKTTFGFSAVTKEAPFAHDMHPPLEPQESKGEDVMRRINKIAPGPFNSKGMEVRQPLGADDASLVRGGHGITRSASTSTAPSRVRAPSTSSSNYTRNPSMSSIAGYTQPNPDEFDVPAVPTVPSVALDYNAPRTQNNQEPANRYTSDASPFNFGSFGQPHRANTFPEDSQHEKGPRRPSEPTDNSLGNEQAVPRRPSDPSVQTHKSKASVMLPLYEIGSASSFKPSKSVRGRRTGSPAVGQPSTEPSKQPNPREYERSHHSPPVLPPPSNPPLDDFNNPCHTPHESVSSNESYGSGMKSTSSRSSPPLNSPLNSNSPQRPKGPLGDDPFNNSFQGFQFGVESQSPPEQSISHDHVLPPTSTLSQSAPLESQEPALPRLSSPPRSVRPMKPAPAPLREIPARQNFSPMTSPVDYLASPVSPFTDHARNIRVSPGIPPPPPIPGSPPRKRTPTSKGQCRGCNEAIYGKSISSADGQLTGRYHKQCFVCKTCTAPFQSSDFYVYENNPYCARHYHEQNGSLCTSCDRGIEGPYLETEQKQKFHPFCFTCEECRLILRDDFFEWNGRILCEQHAFGDAQRAAQQPSSLGPGRRYPERRTTKLMMM